MTHLIYIKHFAKSIGDLLISPLFFVLTLVGNGIILFLAYAYFMVESSYRQLSFFDAIWFSFTTVTTVGYGDHTPQSMPGKIVAILMMLVGTSIFACFTALFANTLLHGDIIGLKKGVKDMKTIEGQIEKKEIELEALINQLKKTLELLENKKNSHK